MKTTMKTKLSMEPALKIGHEHRAAGFHGTCRRPRRWLVAVALGILVVAGLAGPLPRVGGAEEGADAETVGLAAGDDEPSSGRTGRPEGAVYWSDGTVDEGSLIATPGSPFHLHVVSPDADGNDAASDEADGGGEEAQPGQLRSFTLDKVAEIAFVPFTTQKRAAERMARAHRPNSKAPGGVEYFGEPYPVRELGATVRFTDGEEFFGVLRSCAVYVQGRSLAASAGGGPRPTARPGTKKVVLLSRQEGKPGSTLDDLRYVTHLRVRNPSARGGSRVRLELPPGAVRQGDTVTAMVRSSLESVPVTADGQGGFTVGGTLGENLLLAIVRADGSVDVAWPDADPADANLRRLLEEKIALQHDYHDERKVVGILREGPTRAIVLVSLRRIGKDTSSFVHETLGRATVEDMKESARASVWMFRLDEEAGRAALVRRGSFVRQQCEPGSPTPEVRAARPLWPIVRQGDTIDVGSTGASPADGPVREEVSP